MDAGAISNGNAAVSGHWQIDAAQTIKNMETGSPWNTIPLADYELHMQHETVGQLQLLSSLTKKYLEQLRPEIVMFLGIAGGNGLEHIDNKITSEVFGIDINQSYLNETEKRFKEQIPGLNLINIDLSDKHSEIITKANLIWAALIFEYVDKKACFEFINNNIQENGYVAITIQENNGIGSISPTGIESIKAAGRLFNLISETDLIAEALRFEFHKLDFEENILPNKKSLKTYIFGKKTTNRSHVF
jgi:hypothetical protein